LRHFINKWHLKQCILLTVLLQFVMNNIIQVFKYRFQIVVLTLTLFEVLMNLVVDSNFNVSLEFLISSINIEQSSLQQGISDVFLELINIQSATCTNFLCKLLLKKRILINRLIFCAKQGIDGNNKHE